MKDMRLIMESWRKFKEAKEDYPSDGLSPVDPAVFDTHPGGVEPEPRGAPIKNRRQISIYPKPGSLFDASTGQFDVESINDLLSILDSDKDLMMSADDPYVDDWLERTHKAFMDAIEGFKEKGEAEQLALQSTLDAKFADAVEDIQAIIQAREEASGEDSFYDADDTLGTVMPSQLSEPNPRSDMPKLRSPDSDNQRQDSTQSPKRPWWHKSPSLPGRPTVSDKKRK